MLQVIDKATRRVIETYPDDERARAKSAAKRVGGLLVQVEGGIPDYDEGPEAARDDEGTLWEG